MKSTGFSDVIRKSPFGPIKVHMEVSTRSVEELIQFIQYVIKEDWTGATQSRKNISELENKALDQLAEEASKACNPINDKRGTIEFRTHVAGVLAKRTAKIAYDRARENK